jgi:hypothetical protein
LKSTLLPLLPPPLLLLPKSRKPPPLLLLQVQLWMARQLELTMSPPQATHWWQWSPVEVPSALRCLSSTRCFVRYTTTTTASPAL